MTTLQAKPHIKLRSDGSASVVYKVSGRDQIKAAAARYPASNYSSFLSIIRESFSGAWQQNFELKSTSDLLTFPPIYAAITLIASDFAKVRVKITKLTGNVWLESAVPRTSPWLAVLRKPNDFQTRVQFFSNWMTSKLIYGNTYALKQRDARGIVTDLYILDPCRTVPLVSTDGQVFYRLARDDLSGLPTDGVEVPASEIIHDRMETFWHPLIGISPLTAAGIAATQGLNIQGNAATFFQNMSRPAGILVAPGSISPEQAAVIKAAWEDGYGGENFGRTAVLGDDMKYIPMSIPADHGVSRAAIQARSEERPEVQQHEPAG
jgi:HK97 family phage portal protein